MLQDRKIGLKVPTFDDEIIMPQLAMQILDPLLIWCQLCSYQPSAAAATIQPAATTQLDITTSDIILQLGDILHLRDILIDSYWLYLSLSNC